MVGLPPEEEVAPAPKRVAAKSKAAQPKRDASNYRPAASGGRNVSTLRYNQPNLNAMPVRDPVEVESPARFFRTLVFCLTEFAAGNQLELNVY